MTTVLVVDDSPTVREMLADQLKQSGLTVIEAQDGSEAVEKLKDTVPDIVVTDVVMPKMNGYELCRWIKKNDSTKDVPVVMCTTKSEEFDKHWGMKQGADAYITKPYEPADLIKTIKGLLKS